MAAALCGRAGKHVRVRQVGAQCQYRWADGVVLRELEYAVQTQVLDRASN